MAGFKVEQDVCHGRDFTAPAGSVKGGLLYCLATWAIKSLVNGGPGWFMHDDQRALGTDPYIVISSHNAASPNTPAKYIQILLPTATSAQVRVYYFIYWNPTTHVGLGLYGAHNLRTDDSVDFIYDFRGGPECLFMQTYTTAATWEASFIDEFTLDPNLIDNCLATTAVANFSGTGTTQIRGIDLVGGTMANAVDANGYIYISVVNTSGSIYRLDVFKDSGRGAGNLIWQSGTFTAAGSGVAAVITGTAQNGSGVTLRICMLGPTVADATITFRLNKITVGAGEGAQFVNGNFYFITDHSDGRNAVNSFQVLSKSGDVLTVDRLYRPFTAGSKVGSYMHPFFVGGTGSSLWGNRTSIPYYNVAGTMTGLDNSSSAVCEQNSYTAATLSNAWSVSTLQGPNTLTSAEDTYISRQSPDRKGRWAVQRPGVVERVPFGVDTNTLAGITAYGQLKNIILGSQGTMSANLHGRTLGGIDYLFFRLMNAYGNNVQSWAAMIRDTQSNS